MLKHPTVLTLSDGLRLFSSGSEAHSCSRWAWAYLLRVWRLSTWTMDREDVDKSRFAFVRACLSTSRALRKPNLLSLRAMVIGGMRPRAASLDSLKIAGFGRGPSSERAVPESSAYGMV